MDIINEGVMAQWKDTTRYSWSDSKKYRKEPREMTLDTGSVRIVIHKHVDYPGEWFMSCVPELMRRQNLGECSIEKAQAAGLERLRKHLVSVLSVIDSSVEVS